MSITCDPRENHILRALRQAEFELLEPHLELITMSRAEILFEANDKLQYIYFPVTATASLLCCLEDGTSVEVAMVGNEGILGVSALLGGRNLALIQAIINVAGHGYRVSIKSLQNVLARSGGRRAGMLQKLLLRYAQTLFIQMSQTTACNRHHAIEQQLCCWLLLSFDRGHVNSLLMTQESIAYILGVRRESITEAARKLQQAGIINYHRGHIELKDKQKLEDTACECYKVKKEESIRLFTDFQNANKEAASVW
ncbi:Crp/Fnr family transcriptional regulator [Nitrosomonas sp. Nm166]|uniref:Crp/Fnr family transcriptional regulator n=1 Tax=Nitrosomonas sp. Nm166 TaxID=1881054 RepID=UPI0008E1F0EF|nr:Crp/Fnr family transcriptional regulator [Nitrosomonas sp. Nm166]SFF26739.1 cAMP-binding domain of CRP or a regulatory subunit of cAMP-dependent protein kinases [Nitrosomonas sp. Nm166]